MGATYDSNGNYVNTPDDPYAGQSNQNNGYHQENGIWVGPDGKGVVTSTDADGNIRDAAGHLIHAGGPHSASQFEQDESATQSVNTPQMANSALQQNQLGQSRALQLQMLQQQRANALGQGPSVAAIQQRQGMGNALNQAMAAGAGRMGAPALGMGLQGMSGAQGQADAMRAQEMNQALGQYGQGTQQFRGGDLSYQGLQNQQLRNAQALQLGSEQQRNAMLHAYEQDRYNQQILGLHQSQAYSQNLRQRASDAQNNLSAGIGGIYSTMGSIATMNPGGAATSASNIRTGSDTADANAQDQKLNGG